MSDIARILVVDDHPIVRLGLVHLIESDGAFTVAAQADDAESALEVVDDSIDLVVTDLKMGDLDGLALTRLLKVRFPELPVLVLSSFDESLFALQALEARASGYLMKDAAPGALHDAIQAVETGRIHLSDAMWSRLLPQTRSVDDVFITLDGEQRELMHALAETPRTDVALARRLDRTIPELLRLRAGVMRAWGVESVIQLLLLAQRFRTLDAEPTAAR
jgi:DNA-binding NarL/FixJ family response regulator